MNGKGYIYQRQILWSRDLKLIHLSKDKERPGYTQSVNENLFQPLSDRARKQFKDGDGKELGTKSEPGKMQALHSSSALGCNVFDYWQSLADLGDTTGIKPIVDACGLPNSENSDRIFFEKKRPVVTRDWKEFRNPPNLDVVIKYRRSVADIVEVGIECKFSEAYSGGHSGLKRVYLGPDELKAELKAELKEVWEGLSKTKELAKTISPDDKHKRFKYLHAAQLIKHILGLKRKILRRKHRSGREQPHLLYLWYKVPGKAGTRHQEDIKEFQESIDGDRIWFRAISYQDVIGSLKKGYRGRHQAYVDYLTERYL
jgi:hypothetical protein